MEKLTTDKIIGSLIGLAIGDALGAPYEFRQPPYTISPEYIEGGAHGVSVGEWTDDTSMALCLAQSLIDKNGFEPKDQMDKYLSWKEDGYFSTRKGCFDIGNTIAKALSIYRYSKEPYSGISGDNNSGNGSLMRLAPIALYYYQDREALVKYAAKSSQTTHKSEIAVDSCIYFAQLIAGAIKGLSKEELLSKNFIDSNNLREEVKNIINGSYKENKKYKPTGYVIDTLETALMAFYKDDSFEEGLIHVVSLGYDADTVGAVYGQLAGAFYGYESIPKRWTSKLMKHALIYDMAVKLINATKSKDTLNNQIKTNIHVLVGDITTINTDAIVNPANSRLLGGGGVDGAIHKSGGPRILEECLHLRETRYPDGLPKGEAAITSGGDLKANYVIHTVGPKYRFDENPPKALESAYANTLLLADNYKCQSIAFSSIATGVYAYPKEEAAKIAYETINNLLAHIKYIKDIVFVFYSEKDANIFQEINELL